MIKYDLKTLNKSENTRQSSYGITSQKKRQEKYLSHINYTPPPPLPPPPPRPPKMFGFCEKLCPITEVRRAEAELLIYKFTVIDKTKVNLSAIVNIPLSNVTPLGIWASSVNL